MSRSRYLTVVLAGILSLLSLSAQAQRSVQWVKAGVSVPYQFSLQYEWQTPSQFYVAAEAGAFAQPFRKVVFSYASSISGSPIVPEIIKETIESGNLYTLRVGRLFGSDSRWQLGGYLQYIDLSGKQRLQSLQGKYFNVSEAYLPVLSIRSQIQLAGVEFGYRFPISPKFSIHTSMSFGKIFRSDSEIGSSTDNFEMLSKAFANEADESLKNFGIVPAFNIHLAYRLGGENVGRHGNHHNRRAKRLLSRQALMDSDVVEIDW